MQIVVWKEILRSPKCSLGDQLGNCDSIAAEKCGLDYESVREDMEKDGRI